MEGSVTVPPMPPGCLLIHGFTATPPVMGFLKGCLESAGFEVVVPLLAGHGGDWSRYEESGWSEWYQSVMEPLREMKGRASSLFIAGQSLGGLLALKLALEFGSAIQGVACLATPLYLDQFLARFLLPFVSKTPVRKIYRFQSKFGQASLEDPVALKQFRQWSHPKMPIRGIINIQEFQEKLRPLLKGLAIPLLEIHSKRDPLISSRTERFFQSLPCQKEFLLLERSGHIISMDYEKDRVADRMISFFKNLVVKDSNKEVG